MANETILDLVTRVHLEPLNAGMNDAVSKVSSATGAMIADFGKLGVATDASLGELKASVDVLGVKLDEMASQVSVAMAKVASSVTRGAAESSLGLGELKSRFADVGREAEITATGVGNLYGGFGALLGLGALGAFIGSMVDGVDKLAIRIHKLSEETGISTERIQEFQGAMELLHVAPEQAEQAILRLDRSLTLAAEGSKTQAELFQRLGVDLQAWKSGNLDLIGVLEQIQKVTSENISVNEREGIAMQIAGRSAKDFALVLGITSEQFEKLLSLVKQSGGVISEQGVSSLTLMSQQMTLLWLSTKSLIADALVPLLPVIKFVIVAFSELVSGIKGVIDIVAGLVDSIVVGAEYIVGAVIAITTGFTHGLDMMQDAVDRFKGVWFETWDEINANNESAQGRAAALFDENTGKMLQALTKLKEGGSQDILSGITGGSRIEEFKEQLEEMRSKADAFHGLQLEDERTFWQNILETQKLNAKERAEVERELNATLHKIALERYQEQIALDREFIRTSLAGSEERKFAVQKERDDTIAAYGEGSKQAIEANMRVLENQVENDKTAAADVQRSVDQQVESYKAGSQERINLMAAALAQIKTMQDQVLEGRTAQGGPVPEAPVGPTPQADAQLRVQIRQTEAADIGKISASLQAKLAEEYRSETTELQKQITERERLYDEESAKRVELAISSSEKAATEQIKNIERLAQYDLITFSQKIAMTKQVIDAEHQKAQSILETAIAESEVESAVALSAAAQENAAKRVIALKEQLLKLNQQYAQQEINLSDQVANHEMQNAQRAASVISSSFERAFGVMLTQHTNLLTVMTKFWNDMVQGWARMGLQIVAQYVQSLAQIVIREILTQTQITAVQTTGMTARQATQNLWESFLQALGIKTVVQATTTEAQQTAAHVAGIAARQAADTAGNTASLAETIAKNIAEITSFAGVAGGAAFASVIAALPFPINVATAPGVMAGAIALTLGNLALASAAGGMEVTHDQVAMLHKQEMVLPSHLSEGFRNIIAGNGTPGTGGAGGPGGSGGGAGNHVHIGSITLSGGGSREEMRDVLDSELVPRIRRAMRTGFLDR